MLVPPLKIILILNIGIDFLCPFANALMLSNQNKQQIFFKKGFSLTFEMKDFFLLPLMLNLILQVFQKVKDA